MTLSHHLSRWLVWLVLVAVVVGPIYWIVAASFKDNHEIIQRVPSLWPARIHLGNYDELLSNTNYPTYLLNSLIVALCTMAATACITIAAGYAMYRLKVAGSTWLSRAMLLIYLAPTTLLLVPIYSLLASMRLVNTLAGLVIVNVAFASPFCVWLLRGFFDAIPRALDEAAAVDGAGPLTILWKVHLPLLAPGLGTILLYAFVYSWTEFAFASQLIVNDSLKTLPMGLNAIMGSYTINWGLLMAGASLTTLPAVLLFACVGRYFVRGLTAGAVTG
ncbi:carbohydrate ABC transporter permease [Labrys wisconsinensis]|uniref:ABC-type glycerol-3-phosphate transport system permease component n=1 Tax=Labrys wisconsinensis TaxID=425677 RepID=A0ABU0JQ83_9HYPH|nr:carbohydrate ABC transporter permease [Labrys wisconsinensis]MDQ0475307.1 ABC-type glycerol-3-phosphate transport system permease component [Labrys wisconsinensis]